jgi:hypothetical protein
MISPARPITFPPLAFTSSERWNADRIGALALYCSDGRWGDAFDEFCHKHLHIPRYDRWAVPGGPACLIDREADHDFVQAAAGQIDFLVRAHDLKRIILITHYGCAHYGHLFGQSPDECLEAQYDDVRRAAVVLRSWYPGIRVEGYLAMRGENGPGAQPPLRAEGNLTKRGTGSLSFHLLET